MSSETIFLYNAIAYSVAMVILYRKYGISLGLILWGTYTISAWSTWLFVQQPMYYASMHYSTHTITPCIYLFVLFFISIVPLCKLSKLEEIPINNLSTLRNFLIVCIFVQLIFIIVDIPSVIKVLTTQSDLVSLREQAYGKDGEQGITVITQNAILNRFYLLYSGLRPIATGLSIYLFFIFKEERLLTKMFFITTLLENLWHITVLVGRGEIIITIVIYGCTLFLIRDYLSEKTKRNLFVYVTLVLVLGVSAFSAITVSRFGDYASFYMYKYMGETMNNFVGILYPDIQGYTGGQAYFSYINRYLLGDVVWTNTEGRYEFIEKITHIPSFIFYSYVGGLIIEFGKILPVFIIIAFNRWINKIMSNDQMSLGHIVICIALIYFFAYGLFTFPVQNFVGMSMFIFIAFFCYSFRSN